MGSLGGGAGGGMRTAPTPSKDGGGHGSGGGRDAEKSTKSTSLQLWTALPVMGGALGSLAYHNTVTLGLAGGAGGAGGGGGDGGGGGSWRAAILTPALFLVPAITLLALFTPHRALTGEGGGGGGHSGGLSGGARRKVASNADLVALACMPRHVKAVMASVLVCCVTEAAYDHAAAFSVEVRVYSAMQRVAACCSVVLVW